jgi:cytochrome c5
MRKATIILSLMAGTFIMVKCTPKASKTIAETPKTAEVTNAPPEPATPVSATVPGTAYSAEQIESGKTVFNNNCAKCHKLYSPTAFTATQWMPILKGMIPKAKLSETDAILVKAYVFSNAKQG